MRRTILTTSLLVILTLCLTQLATAQWKDNVFTNNSSGDVYVAFTTYRPAADGIPLGWRTTAWYRINAGGSHTFQAWDDNPIYYLVWEEDTDSYWTPDDGGDTYTHWESVQAFVLVSQREPNVNVSAANLLYSNRDRGTLEQNSNFFKSENGDPVTVDGPGGEDTGPRGKGGEDGIKVVTSGGNSLSVGVYEKGTTPADVDAGDARSASMSLATGEERRVIFTYTRDGAPVSEIQIRLRINNIEDGSTPTLSSNSGVTNENGRIAFTVRAHGSNWGSFRLIGEQPAVGIRQELDFTVATITLNTSNNTYINGTTVEPRKQNFNGQIPLTLKVIGSDGNPSEGLKVRWFHTGMAAHFGSTGEKTDENGIARNTLTLGSGGNIGTLTAQVDVEGYDTRRLNLNVRPTASRFNLNRSGTISVTSGQSRSVAATVYSKNGAVMRGATVYFSCHSDLRFSNGAKTQSRQTNSSGVASVTLQTSHITQAARKVTARVSGTSPEERSFKVNVTHYVRTETEGYSVVSREDWWRDWYTWRGKVDFDSATKSNYKSVDVKMTEVSSSDECCISKTVNWKWFDSNTIEIWGRIKEHRRNSNTGYVVVTVKYNTVRAFGAAAPPLQPQLRSEIDALPSVWQDLSQVPLETALLPNYPNPFNPETWIPYHLGKPAEVTLTIYSTNGQLVRTLALGHQAAGVYESKSRAAYWDGRNTMGERVASGVYFYMFTAGNFTATGKMLIMK